MGGPGGEEVGTATKEQAEAGGSGRREALLSSLLTESHFNL